MGRRTVGFLGVCFALSFSSVNAQTLREAPQAFLSIHLFGGRHDVIFREYAKSPGFSFGFKVNAGLYLSRGQSYRGGLHYTLIEGASYNSRRRKLSEDFSLPYPQYDKHLVFKFAQFRSSTIGWFSELEIENLTLFHQIGFGIFGLTEKSPLLDFSMHNHLGLRLGDFQDRLSPTFGLLHDVTIGIGNPNYDVNNWAASVGGQGGF